jgi:hypothetical protein
LANLQGQSIALQPNTPITVFGGDRTRYQPAGPGKDRIGIAMKSPRVLSRLMSPRNADDSDLDDAMMMRRKSEDGREETLRIVSKKSSTGPSSSHRGKKTREKYRSGIPRRNVTLTNSSSSSQSSSPDADGREETQLANSDEERDEKREDENDLNKRNYDDDAEDDEESGSVYSAGSEGGSVGSSEYNEDDEDGSFDGARPSKPRRAKILKALNFTRVLGSNLRRRRRRQRWNRMRARGELSDIDENGSEDYDDDDDDDSYDTHSRYGSRSTYSSCSSGGNDKSVADTTDDDEEDAALEEQESAVDDDDDDELEAAVAAEALGKDLEAMGYNLNCDSFITKDSTIDPNEERYARRSPRRQSKKKAVKKIVKKKGVSREELSEKTEEESTVVPMPATKLKKEKDDTSENRSIKITTTGLSVGSLSNPSDAIDKQSLQTNTSSKLARRERAATQKYGRPFSPPNMDSLASLREYVDLTKKHKRTIAPPAIAMYEAKHNKAEATAKNPIPKTETTDAESIAAMSGDGNKTTEKKKTKSSKLVKESKSDWDRKTAFKKKESGKLTPNQSSNNVTQSNVLATDSDVIIEGMSVVMANQIARKRREGIEPYKQVLPDPPEKEGEAQPLPRTVAIPPTPPQRLKHTRATATLTTATALTSPDHGTRIDSSMAPDEAIPPLEQPKKGFFALPILRKRRERSSVPRVPNLPQTPKAMVVDMSKTPRHDPSEKKFQLPEAIITRDEAREVPSRQQTATPSAFKLPSSIHESAEAQQVTNSKAQSLEKRTPRTGVNLNRRQSTTRENANVRPQSPIKDALQGVLQGAKKTLSPKKTSIDRFFATVGSTDCVVADEETMAPGQIEVTFDSSSMVEGDLLPVGRVEVAPTPRKWNPLSPRSRDPPPGARPAQAPDPPTEQHEKKMDQTVVKKISSPKERVVSLRLLKHHNPPPPPLETIQKKPFPRLAIFNRNRNEAHKESMKKRAATSQEVARDCSVQGTEESPVVIENLKIWSNDSTFGGLEDIAIEGKQINIPVEDHPVQGEADHEQPSPPTVTKAQSLDRARSAPVTSSDLKTAVQNLITSVFHPETVVEAERVSNKERAKHGLTQDWFNLDVLGNLDWAATRSTTRKAKSKSRHQQTSLHGEEIDTTRLRSSTIATTQSRSDQARSLPTQTQSLISQSLLTERNQHSLVDYARMQSLPTQSHSLLSQSLTTEGKQRTLEDMVSDSELAKQRGSSSADALTSRAMEASAITSLETVDDGTRMESKRKVGLFRKLRYGSASKTTEPYEDRMSTGISSAEPSSNYFHVEYNDDNDLKASSNRPSLSRSSLRKKQVEVPPRHQVPILVDSPAYNNTHRGHAVAKTPNPVFVKAPKNKTAVNPNQTRNLPNSATLSTNPTDTYVGPGALNLDSYLRSDTSSDADTWAEIADASMVVERAMERLDTFRSDDDTEDPAKLKYLLSVVSDEDTIGDVEKALNTLKKHASRLGVKETDLLLAVASQGGTPRSNGTAEESDTKSYKSLTLGEELLNILGMFVKPQTQSKRRRSRGKSSRHKKTSYSYR